MEVSTDVALMFMLAAIACGFYFGSKTTLRKVVDTMDDWVEFLMGQSNEINSSDFQGAESWKIHLLVLSYKSAHKWLTAPEIRNEIFDNTLLRLTDETIWDALSYLVDEGKMKSKEKTNGHTAYLLTEEGLRYLEELEELEYKERTGEEKSSFN
jgi:DNA-binding PadR family transcriptional regulator